MMPHESSQSAQREPKIAALSFLPVAFIILVLVRPSHFSMVGDPRSAPGVGVQPPTPRNTADLDGAPIAQSGLAPVVVPVVDPSVVRAGTWKQYNGIIPFYNFGNPPCTVPGKFGNGYDGLGLLYAISGGTGANAVTFTFAVPPGNYSVQATWCPAAGLAACYQVYDDQKPLATIKVDQGKAPRLHSAYKVSPFQSLGNFQIASGKLRVVISDLGVPAGTTVYADAIRVAPPLWTPPPIPPGVGTANIVTSLNPPGEVIAKGQSIALTYNVTGAVKAWIQKPDGTRDMLALPSGTYQFAPPISSPFPLIAQDAAGNKVTQPLNVLVKGTTLVALDPTAPAIDRAVANGSWMTPATWASGVVPGPDDIVAIPPGISVTCGGRAGYCGRLINHGSFTVANGVFYLTDYEDDGQGSLTLDGTNGKALMVFRNRPLHPRDRTNLWRGACISGTLVAKGIVQTPFVRLASPAWAGDTALNLASPVTGWTQGNKLEIPDTRCLTDTSEAGYQSQTETVIVRGVSADGMVVFLLQPVQFDHGPAINEQGLYGDMPHVARVSGLTTGFITEDPTDLANRGHIQVSGRATLDLDGMVIHGFGRAPTKGPMLDTDRHSLTLKHFYGPLKPLTPLADNPPELPNGPQWRIRNCVVLDPPPVVPISQARWGVALNDAHYGHFKGNVIFNWGGSSFAQVSGNESYSVIEGNLALGNHSLGGNPRDNNGTDGSGWFINGLNNWYRNNVAAACFNGDQPGAAASAGFYWNYPVTRPLARVPKSQGADTSIHANVDLVNLGAKPILQFKGNESYGPCATGISFWNVGPAVNSGQWNVIDGFRSWNHWQVGCAFFYPCTNIVINDAVCYMNPLNPANAMFAANDYTFANVTINRAVGIGCASMGYCSARGGTIIWQDCKFVAGWRWHMSQQHPLGWFSIQALASPGTGGLLPPCKTEINNCLSVQWPGDRGPFMPIVMDANLRDYQRTKPPAAFASAIHYSNYAQLDQTLVKSHQQVPGDDFQAFYAEQAATSIMPQTVLDNPQPPKARKTTCWSIGCPDAGMTNAQSAAKYSYGYTNTGWHQEATTPPAAGQTPLCTAGQVAPATARKRPDVYGLVVP
jgi:hypothetical protein